MNIETRNQREKELRSVIRAFWRRIEPFKNNFGKELPAELPIEFTAHFSTALTALDLNVQQDAEAAFMASQIESQSGDLSKLDPQELLVEVVKLGYRQVSLKP